VLPADVLDEHQDLAAGRGERAAVHRAGLLVDGFVLAHLLEQHEKIRVGEGHVVSQLDAFYLLHQVAEQPSPVRSRW